MRAALALAARGLGATWPNPSVGCVIVSPEGKVVGRGRTGTRGRPHAETNALAMAGAAASRATAYVTLEPCSHHGHTPPCADALIAAGIARVVVAAGDPDKRVNGAGLARLKEAGLTVESGFMAEQAHETLAGFFARVRLGRPLVTLKLASTLDGRIATRTGESQWITGSAARLAVQTLRGRHDAVMTGVHTIHTDDPDLTCRLPGYAHRPTVRIVADSFLRTPRHARIVATAHKNPSWILYHTDSLPEGVSPADAQPGEILPSRAQRLAEAGARCILVPKGEQGIDLQKALAALGTRGLTRIMVEGGSNLAASLLRDDLVDRIVWFHAPAVLGADALPAVQALTISALAEMRRFKPASSGPRQVGNDVMTEFLKVEDVLF
jgi:diaminohydroxyphosphoribosylaminopyrimidine deaminase/5-amino-6-(5-phosphoribosylamino)uracil reductase